MTNKVWVLMYGQATYEDFRTIEGIFTTKEAAQAYQDLRVKEKRVNEDVAKWGDLYYSIYDYEIQ